MSHAGEGDLPAGSAPDDLNAAQALLAGQGQPPPDAAQLRLVARALRAARSGAAGAVRTGELRRCHDQLWSAGLRPRVPGLARALAEALLRRGVVPGPGDCAGEWHLWWPQQGWGPCQYCQDSRALRRYSPRSGKPYRYLCRRCRAEESCALDSQNAVTSVAPGPDEDADSPLTRHLLAAVEQLRTEFLPQDGSAHVRWDLLAAQLKTLLGPLAEAGWRLPRTCDTVAERETGPHLLGELERTGMVIAFGYEAAAGVLRLFPVAQATCYRRDVLSMLDASAAITVGPHADQGAARVRERAGELGLLDATRLKAAADSDVGIGEHLADCYQKWIFEPAREYRQIPMQDLLDSLDADEAFATYYRVVIGWIGARVLPDLIPDAAALGVAGWCWRQNTAVADRQLPSDVLMARVNIAATKAVRPHVSSRDGIDWPGVETALTDPAWALPDGRVISGLFGPDWPDVQRTVREQVRLWQRIDEQLVGQDAALRLLTIGGSTSYTRHWWGQGRWPAICGQIITEAQQAGVPLPGPYEQRGTAALLRDVADPDLLSDDVLSWLIDPRGADADGPAGLRHHRAATRPVTRWFRVRLQTG